MKQEILTRFPWPWLPTIALLIFFLFFAGLIIRISMNSFKKISSRAELLPMEDGEAV